jgi:DNA-binding protein HU-beta
MNKQEFILAVAEATEQEVEVAQKSVEAMLNIIMQRLKAREDVRLIGFGTFAAVERKASMGRNPSTNEVIAIPAAWLPKFKAGKTLKDTIA